MAAQTFRQTIKAHKLQTCSSFALIDTSDNLPRIRLSVRALAHERVRVLQLLPPPVLSLSLSRSVVVVVLLVLHHQGHVSERRLAPRFAVGGDGICESAIAEDFSSPPRATGCCRYVDQELYSGVFSILRPKNCFCKTARRASVKDMFNIVSWVVHWCENKTLFTPFCQKLYRKSSLE